MAYFRKKGEKWYYTIEISRSDGNRKKVERVGGRTKKEAQQAYLKDMQEMNNRYGRFVKPCDITFLQYLEQWLDEYVKYNLSDNTQLSYRSNIKNHIAPTLGMYKLLDVSPNMLQKFVNDKSKKYSAGTLHVLIGILKKSLSYAVQPCEFLQSNPAQYLEAPKQAEKVQPAQDTYIFSKKEVEQIFSRFSADHDFYIPIMIAYHTGLRLGECLALQWSDVDEKGNMLTVRHTLIDKTKPARLAPPKSKSARRTIPYSDDLHKVLHLLHIRQATNRLQYGKNYVKNDFVCTHENGELITADDMRYFGKYCHEKINEKASFHSLRHTHATMLLENGLDLDYVSKRLGHSSIAITAKTYSHVTEKRHENALKVLNRVL